MNKRIDFSIVIILMLIIINGCFPTYTVQQQNKENMVNNSVINVGSKIQTFNDDVYIFPKGFTLQNDSIKGLSQVYSFGKSAMAYTYRAIPVENVATINCYEETTSGARTFASFLFSITGPPLTALSLYCVSCPKCCFGSCPTVYTKGEEKFELETELFSESISRHLEITDLDILAQKLDSNGKVELRITNEALETHYIDKFNLVAINHPPGTKIFPTFKDSLLLISSYSMPSRATNNEGEDITNLIQNDDGNYYRSGTENINDFKNGILYDYVNIRSNIPKGFAEVKVVIKYRNTLLSTILLYDVVLASQGIEAVEWTEKMNTDAQYASDFKMIYDKFSGITVDSKINNAWQYEGILKDAGPITWRYAAFKVPVDYDGTLNIKLKFITDNMMIDYIAIDTSNTDNFALKFNSPESMVIKDESGKIKNEAADFIEKSDGNYLITNPGDNFSIEYQFSKSHNKEQTLAIFSQGYYNEWIRGEWIRNNFCNYKFDLYDIKGTCSYLADSWLKNKDTIEREFFNNRIPLKRSK